MSGPELLPELEAPPQMTKISSAGSTKKFEFLNGDMSASYYIILLKRPEETKILLD